MKYYLLLLFLMVSLLTSAQPTASEIKKYKIKKAVEKRIDQSGTFETFWYYDSKGYDSLQSFFDGVMIVKNTVIDGKLTQKRLIRSGIREGEKDDLYTYEYKPDGSYKETFTDGNYQMKSYDWYDKAGKLLKSQSPDGNTITYKYDTKGRLVSMISDGKNNGIKINHRNTYNTKGQLIKQERNTDGEKATILYNYDAKGILIKDTWKPSPESGIPTTTSVYQYNNKGLITKKTSTSVGVDGTAAMITYEFEYEYY